jgi:hypothetical protein
MAILHYMNERKEPTAKEHRKMAKFPNAQDDLYRSVCERLKDMATDGLGIQRARRGLSPLLWLGQHSPESPV